MFVLHSTCTYYSRCSTSTVFAVFSLVFAVFALVFAVFALLFAVFAVLFPQDSNAHHRFWR